jgi:uncharacterized SAM-binding protein YcdF (DUF218 family)
MLKHKKSNKIKLIFLLIALLILISGLTYKPILQSIGDFLVIDDPLSKADVIHVIAGGDYRTEYAINLYKQGYGKILFFTGGWCNSHQYYHGLHGKEVAEAHGVPSVSIRIDESPVKSTYSEALRLKKFIESEKEPVESIIVVSDRHHMRRSRWAYRKIFGEKIRIQMAPVPFELSPYQQIWWREVHTRHFVISEYEKLVYYYARYQISFGIIKRWLESLDTE